MIGFGQEIERGEQACRFYRALLDCLPAAAYTCDADGSISYYNPAAERMWGRAPKLNDRGDRFCGSVQMFSVDGAPVRHDDCYMAQVLADGRERQGEVVIERPGGQRVHAVAHVRPILDEEGRVVGAVNLLLDRTEARLANETVQEIVQATAPATGRSFFRALATHLTRACRAEVAFVGVLDEDDSTRIETIAVSRRGDSMPNFRYELRGTPCERILAAGYCYVPNGASQAYPGVPRLAEMESFMGVALHSSRGAPLGVIAVLHHLPLELPERAKAILDVVAPRAAAEIERENAEAALRTSEARLAGIVNNLDGIVWEGDPQTGRFRFVSPQLERILGYSPEAWIESPGNWIRSIHPDDRRWVLREFVPSSLEVVDHDVEYRLVAADGRVVWVHSRVAVETVDRTPVAWHGVMVDVTERKNAEEERRDLEEKMHHTQKLESLGVLAGGIAHDFNNLLTSMMGNAGLALMRLPNDSPVRPMLEEIVKAAERSAELTEQMLTYSGKADMVGETVRLDQVVREMAELLRTSVSKKAMIHLVLDAAPTEGDPTQIRQIAMNLITNASESLGDRVGEIHVRTGVREMGSVDLESPFLPEAPPAGSYAYLEVEDTGGGIGEEVLPRIFEPFFTTKFTGRGLGLAATLGIIRRHGGTIGLSSQPGEGTTFRVFLPSVVPSSALAPLGPDRVVFSPGGRRMVLVVDDEPGVRLLLRRLLEQAGFEVRTAEDGVRGLKEFEESRSSIVAVVLDFTMPGMDGLEVLRKLRRRSPDLPVLVMSGHGDEEISKRCLEFGACEFCKKPFSPQGFVDALSRMLSARCTVRVALAGA